MSLVALFRGHDLNSDEFTLSWIIPAGYDFQHFLTSWTIRHHTGAETYDDYPLAASVTSQTAVADLGLTIVSETEYYFTLIANFEETVRNDDPYTGSSDEYVSTWTESSDQLTVTSTAPYATPVLTKVDWPDYGKWLAGQVTMSFEISQLGLEEGVTYAIFYKEDDPDATWEWAYTMTWEESQAHYPDPVVYTHDIDPNKQYQFFCMASYTGFLFKGSDVITYDVAVSELNSFNHQPFSISILKALNPPANIFIGNIQPNTPFDPYSGAELPGDMTEWIRTGEALYSSDAVWIYRRVKSDKTSSYYPTVEADWDTFGSNVLYRANDEITTQGTSRFWDMSTYSSVSVYIPDDDFDYNGNNNPFIPLAGLTPVNSRWEFPTTSFSYTAYGTYSVDETPNVGVITEIDSAGNEKPRFNAIDIDNAAYEIVGSNVEDYVRPMAGLSANIATYKMYVFMPHEYVLSSSFKIRTSAGVASSLVSEDTDITFNGRKGQLFSLTRTAVPYVNPALNVVQMAIDTDQFTIEDASAHVFGSITWPRAPIQVAQANNGSSFYMDANGSVTAVAPADPYDTAAAEMITEFILTNTYAKATLA